MKKIADIEVLRGISILYVLVEHSPNLVPWEGTMIAPLQRMFNGGVGVDLFFTISGFVIARGLVPQLADATGFAHSLRVSTVFWLRRAWRLLPAAWLWLALPVLASWLFNRSGVFGTVAANVQAATAGLFYYANAHLMAAWGVPELHSATFPYWSLSLEEQFYVALPLALILLRRRFALVSVAVVAYALASPNHGVFPQPFRPEGLLLGVLIAIWSGKRSFAAAQARFERVEAVLRPVILAGFLLLPFSVHLVGKPYGHVPVALVCALLVFIAAADRDWFLPRPGSSHLMLWLGARSYGLYLVHVPAFFATREAWFRLDPSGALASDHPWPVLLCGVALMLLSAELSFRWVEAPLRRYGRGVADRYRARHLGAVE